jgi:DNA modification methylase
MNEYTDQQILELLPTHTYEKLVALTGRSKGDIYRIALKNGARKTESRIKERKADREKRQLETLAAITNSTAKADVLDFLETLPDDSIDLFFTSPPYNIGKGYGEGASADVMRHTYFHGWLMMVISEMTRIVKPGGVVAMNIGKTMDANGRLMPMSHLIYNDFVSSGLQFQSEVVWQIPHGLTPKRRMSERHETILIFSKGDVAKFNANAARTPQKQPGKKAYKGPNKGNLSGNPFGAHPSDVWSDISSVRSNHPDKVHGNHPAQFPVLLPKRAILLYTNPGDIVCDPFHGSGSTQVACVEAERNFVGCDLFYEDLRAKRVSAARPDNVCLLPGVTDESVAVWQAEARRVEYAVPAKAASMDLFG